MNDAVENAISRITRFLDKKPTETETEYMRLVIQTVFKEGEVVGIKQVNNMIWEK